MTDTIFVINPNSSKEVTHGIDSALAPLRFENAPLIECHTLADGPPGIQSEADIMAVMPLLADFIKHHEQRAAAFVIACFSDPGMAMAREATSKPVFGIGESAMLSAMTRGERIGVIAIQPTSIARHRRHWRAMGIDSRLAGERALNLDVVELADDERTWQRLLEIGQQLRDNDRADVLVLGCAGLARFQKTLSEALGVAVIDPCRATVGMALAAATTS